MEGHSRLFFHTINKSSLNSLKEENKVTGLNLPSVLWWFAYYVAVCAWLPFRLALHQVNRFKRA